MVKCINAQQLLRDMKNARNAPLKKRASAPTERTATAADAGNLADFDPQSVTVAILAQGTHRAVAASQAFLLPSSGVRIPRVSGSGPLGA